MRHGELGPLFALFMLTMLAVLVAIMLIVAVLVRAPGRPRSRRWRGPRWWHRMRSWRRPRRLFALRWRSGPGGGVAMAAAAPVLASPPATMPAVQPPLFRPAPAAPARPAPAAPARPAPGAPAPQGPPGPASKAAATPVPQAVPGPGAAPVPQTPPGPEPAAGPPLPATAVVDCRSHASLFSGWCAPPHATRRMHVRGAAWRGGLHSADGSEGQDAVGAAWDPATGTLFVAVADGLGSLPGSGPLAREAVRASLRLCLKRPGGRSFAQLGPQLFRAVADGLRRQFGPDVAADAGTTLVVAELAPAGPGARLTVHGVGDSEGWVLRDGDWSPVHLERGPVGNGPVSHATRDLPTDPVPRTEQHDLARGDMLMLATDGFAEPIGRPGWWSTRVALEFRAVPAPLDFLRVVAPEDGDESDDRGVVAVWLG